MKKSYGFIKERRKVSTAPTTMELRASMEVSMTKSWSLVLHPFGLHGGNDGIESAKTNNNEVSSDEIFFKFLQCFGNSTVQGCSAGGWAH